MSNFSEKAKSVTPWSLILSVILVVVKYVAAPSMSWWIVLAPLWAPWVIALVFLLGLGVAMFVLWLIENILDN